MINLGSIQMPINAATKTFAILAKRGAGKSYTGAVMAEEFFKNDIPFVVFDPIDVWWGLRFAADGKSKGLPVVVFGLEHADITIDRDMGRKIAQAVVKENISCVISTFGMPKVAQRHLIAEFSEELLSINRTPRHIFIEEAHEFVPQRVFGGLGKTFNAVSNLVVMGRNKGIGVTLINQRAATVNKDVLTQLDTLLAFRNTSPQDRKALQEWVEYHSAEGDFKKFMDSLPSLPVGEGWIWSPEFLGIFERIKIRKRETLHPDRETIGGDFVMPQLDLVDVQQFIGRFADSMKQVKKNEKELKKIAPGMVVPPESPRESQELIAMRNQYESDILQKDMEIRRLSETINQVRRVLGSEVVAVNAVATGYAAMNGNIEMWLNKLGNSGASRIFKFVAEKSGMKFTRSQIGLATGLSSKSGSFRTYMSTLKRNNLIIEKDNQVQLSPDL